MICPFLHFKAHSEDPADSLLERYAIDMGPTTSVVVSCTDAYTHIHIHANNMRVRRA